MLALAFLILPLPAKVHALSPISVASDNSCLSCHENLYYLHDTGCWYCMSESHRDRCVDCHEGDPTAVQEEAAHLGLLTHPQANGGVKCLECHTSDEAQMRISEFDSNQGFETVVEAEPYEFNPVETGFPNIVQPNPIKENLGWLGFAFLAFGIWLVLVTKS